MSVKNIGNFRTFAQLFIYITASQLVCQQLLITSSTVLAVPLPHRTKAAEDQESVVLPIETDRGNHHHDNLIRHHAIAKRQNYDEEDTDPSWMDQHYREKLKEMSQDSERSYNDIMKELRKDQILLRDQEEEQRLWEDMLVLNDNDEDKIGKTHDKLRSNFWTILICGAIIVIITLIGIIISLAVHNRRSRPQEAYRATNLEAPKIVVEENLYTTTTHGSIPAVRESLLLLANPNPVRQPMAPFTYSPIPIRTDTSAG